MTTDLKKLKKAKGVPPKIEGTTDLIAENARPEDIELRPLQVRIPKSVFEEFSECAGREFGFIHGAKKQMFLKMWKAYKAHNVNA